MKKSNKKILGICCGVLSALCICVSPLVQKYADAQSYKFVQEEFLEANIQEKRSTELWNRRIPWE